MVAGVMVLAFMVFGSAFLARLWFIFRIIRNHQRRRRQRYATPIRHPVALNEPRLPRVAARYRASGNQGVLAGERAEQRIVRASPGLCHDGVNPLEVLSEPGVELLRWH